jgi:SAM-dependent methyltransferase
MPHHFGNPHHHAEYLRKLEGADRARWQKPAAVVRALKLRKRDVVADIGAGPAYFARRLAKQAAFVFAVEVDPEMFPVLVERTRKLRNLAPVFGLPGDPRLAPASVDLALIVNTYHHFEGGSRSLKTLAQALKPGGRMVNIDFHDRELPVGPQHHKISREQFLADARRAGLRLIREHDWLPYQYFVELAAK